MAGRTIGSSIQFGNHPLLLRIPLTVLRHALKRVKGRRSRFRRLAHSHIISEYGVERAVPDAFSQLQEAGDLRFLIFCQRLGLGDLKGLRMVSVGGSRKGRMVRGLSTGYKGLGLGLSRSSSGSQGRSTPPIL